MGAAARRALLGGLCLLAIGAGLPAAAQASTCVQGTGLKLAAIGSATPVATIYPLGASPQFRAFSGNPGLVTVTDYFGTTTTVQPSMVATYSGWVMTLPAQTVPGYYELNVTAVGGGTPACMPFAVVQYSGLDPRFGVNTQVGLGDPAGLDRIVKAANIGAVRDILPWSNVVASGTGAVSVPAGFDTYMASLASDGIMPLLTLGFGNPAFEPGGSTVYTLPYGAAMSGGTDTASFAAYAGALASRYKKFGTNLSFAIWNEVNGTFCQGPACDSTADRASAYDTLTRATAAAVRAGGLRPRVVDGASAGIPLPWFEQLFVSGSTACTTLLAGGSIATGTHHLLDVADAIDIHTYGTPQQIDQSLQDLQALAAGCGPGATRPVVATEFGTSDWRSPQDGYATARHQAADVIVQSASVLLARGVSTFYWYGLHDRTITIPGDPENLLSTPDNGATFVPAPAYPAYGNLIAQLHGRTPFHAAGGALRGSLAPDARTRIYGFVDGNSTSAVYVAWTTPEMLNADIRGLDTATVGFKAPGAASLVDVMGRTLHVWPAGSQITLTLTSQPVYLHVQSGVPVSFTSGAPPLLASTLVDFGPSYPVASGLQPANPNGPWSYGGIIAPNGDATSVVSGFQASFRPATQWTTGSWGFASLPSFSVSGVGQEPVVVAPQGGTRQSFWAVRRWTCPAAGPSCAVNIAGNAHLASLTGAGTRVMIIAGDQVVYAADLVPDGTTNYAEASFESPVNSGQPVAVTVAPGQPIDIAVTTGPMLPGGVLSQLNDFTAVEAWIVAQPGSAVAQSRSAAAAHS